MPPFEPLSYNYVAPAVGDDRAQVVLKLGPPGHELSSEIQAVKELGGDYLAAHVDSDPGRGILITRRLKPGNSLLTLEDDQSATSIAATVMRRVWRPAPAEGPFLTAQGWGLGFERLRRRFDGGAGPFPGALVEHAESLFTELLSSMGPPALIHGDLHHGNILREAHGGVEAESPGGRWVAIDPKGLVAEREYEVGALLRNPLPRLLMGDDPNGLTARRVDQLSEELGFDRERIVGWGLAQAVLSAWWSFEDHGEGWADAIEVAKVFAQLAK